MISENQIKNREENLKLQYESLRKDFDIILTSMIPTQKNLMKTIMWVNVTLIALISTQYKSFTYPEWLIIPFSFSALSFILILWSLKTGREKMLGHIDSQEIHSLNNDEFEKVYGLLMLIEALEIAISSNLEILKQRGKSIADATNFTILSVLFSVIYLIIAINFI